MKAVIQTGYGGPEVLEVRDVARPTFEDNEILVKIHASTVSTSGGFLRRGEPLFVRLIFGLRKPKKPIPGTDFAGIVEEVGRNVSKHKKGDKVFGATDTSFSTHAQFITVKNKDVIKKIPKNMNYSEAASVIEGALTALSFLRDKGKIKKGKKVLIIGASGAVGSAAVQLAKYFEANVTGVTSGKNEKLVKSLGADKIIDYNKQDFTKSDEKYDIIFDTIGKSSFGKAKDSLSEEGFFLSTVLKPILLLQTIYTSKIGKKKSIFQATGLRKHKDKIKDLELIIEIIEKGEYRSIIDKEYTIDEIRSAYEYVDSGHKVGNVVLLMWGGGKR